MITLDKPMHIIAEDGVWRIPAAQFLGPIAGLGNALSASAVVATRNVFSTGEGPAHMAVCGNEVFTSVRLKTLVMTTFFTARENNPNPVLTPTFVSGNGALEMTLSWLVPASTPLYFGVVSTPKPDGRVSLLDCYLFIGAMGSEGKAFHRLPLPNVFPDGRICMGKPEKLDPIRSASNHEDHFKALLSHFLAAKWNSDLLPGRVSTDNMFRWDPATLLPITPVGPLANCTRVSSPILEKFCL